MSFHNSLIYSDLEKFDFLNAFGMVAMFMLQLGYPAEPTKLSTKILFWTLLITGFMLINCYNAILTSYLAISKYDLKVKDLEGLYEKGYNVMVKKGSAAESYFSHVRKPIFMHEKMIAILFAL